MTNIIIARYNEKLEWISRLKDYNKLFIYNKGRSGAAPGEIIRPNIGREAETYLYHIIENYDSLTDWTIFLQGNPMDHSDSLDFNPDGAPEFCPLNPKRMVVEHYNKYLRPFNLPVLNKARDLGLGNIKSVEFPAGAQFAVSKNRILSRPKSFYQELHRQLHIGPEMLHFDANYYSRPNYDPECIDAWILERLWPIIFQNRDIQ